MIYNMMCRVAEKINNYLPKNYLPVNHSKLQGKLPPSQVGYLTGQIWCHMVDGGTTRNHDAYWTVHMSTMERKVYSMETREATNVSHTGEWIMQLVLEVSSMILEQNWIINMNTKVVDEIGRERMSAIVTDVRKRMVTRLTNLSNKYKYSDEPF